jgi:hypothetical protein
MSSLPLSYSYPLDCRIPHLENNSYLYGATPPSIESVNYSKETDISINYKPYYRNPVELSTGLQETYAKSLDKGRYQARDYKYSDKAFTKTDYLNESNYNRLGSRNSNDYKTEGYGSQGYYSSYYHDKTEKLSGNPIYLKEISDHKGDPKDISDQNRRRNLDHYTKDQEYEDKQHIDSYERRSTFEDTKFKIPSNYPQERGKSSIRDTQKLRSRDQDSNKRYKRNNKSVLRSGISKKTQPGYTKSTFSHQVKSMENKPYTYI